MVDILFEIYLRVMTLVVSVTFNKISAISWQSVSLVKETGVPGENHRPVASNVQTLSHNVVSGTSRHERKIKLTTPVFIGTDCIGSCGSNYHTISPVWVTAYYKQAHSTLLLVVEDRLNKATSLLCVATSDGGGRDPFY